MAVYLLAPDSIISQTTFSAVVGAVNANDGTWALIGGNNVSGNIRVSYPTPSYPPNIGAGLQKINVQVRQQSVGQTGTPTCSVDIFETGGGTALASIAAQNVTSESSQILTFTWNASVLGTSTGSAVEARVNVTASGGTPAARESVDIGYIEWEVQATRVFELDIAVGSYTLTGKNLGFSGGTKVGSYSITGQPVIFTKFSPDMQTVAGVYSITKASYVIKAARNIDVDAGLYTLSGVSARVGANKQLDVTPGVYSRTQAPYTFLYNKSIKAAVGSYSITKTQYDFEYDQIEPAAPGTYTIAGNAALLKKNTILLNSVGSYTITGAPVILAFTKNIAAAQGVYSISGLNADLKYPFKKFPVGIGLYSMSGVSAKLGINRPIPTQVGSFTLTGTPVKFNRNKPFAAAKGIYTLAGTAATVKPNRNLDVDKGIFSLSLKTVNLKTKGRIGIEQGLYSITGKSADLKRAEQLDTAVGSYSITKAAYTIKASRSLKNNSGVYSLSGKISDLRTTPKLEASRGWYEITGQLVNFKFNKIQLPCVPYNFKREVKVYLVYTDINQNQYQYPIEVSEIGFNQTLQEHSYSSKTLHIPNMFEQSVINKANPGNFNLTFSAIKEADFHILFDRSLDYDTFDLYVATKADTFKLEKCVIINANFILERNKALGMGIQGELCKLTKWSTTIPGTPVPRSNTMSYSTLSNLSILLDSSNDQVYNPIELNDHLASISIELQNDINWIPYTSVNGALLTDIMYPNNFVLEKRILAGTFVRYLTDDNISSLMQWSRRSSIKIEAGQKVGNDFYGFNLNMQYCSFTNRVGTENIFTQSYDWRMTQNPSNLSDIVQYITSP